MTTLCKQFRIQGRVQGVFYRANSQNKARELNLTGFARNEDDGSVTVCVCGEEDAIEVLQEWLWQGPPAAVVYSVTEEPCQPQTFSDFTTL